MKYQFSLDRNALAVFALGLCLAGALVFTGGLLTGLNLHLPALPMPIIVANKPAAAAPSHGTAAVPGAGAATPAPAPASAASATNAAAAAPGAASAPPPAAATAVATAANSCVDAATTPAPAADAKVFAIQLGAFLDAANATRLAATLKSHGCDASVSQLTDRDNRAWTVVRLGQFYSLQDAARAAADFKRTQGMLALVRPAHAF